MFEWGVTVAGSPAGTIFADTFMEAELQARIQYGSLVYLEIRKLDPPDENDEDWDDEAD